MNSQGVHKSLFLFACTITAYVLLISPAMAQSPMAWVLCQVAGMLFGNLGRGLATLGILVVGVGALIGKTSWGTALTVAVGIGVLSSAAWIAEFITGRQVC